MTPLTITERVLAELAGVIRKSNGSAPAGACFRFTVTEAGDPNLALDQPSPQDREYQYDGKTVLVVSESLAEYLAGRTLDVNDAGDFVFS